MGDAVIKGDATDDVLARCGVPQSAADGIEPQLLKKRLRATIKGGVEGVFQLAPADAESEAQFQHAHWIMEMVAQPSLGTACEADAVAEGIARRRCCLGKLPRGGDHAHREVLGLACAAHQPSSRGH